MTDYFLQIRNSRIFNIFAVSVIIMAALHAGAITYDLPGELESYLVFFDYAITIIFLIEILIRLLAEKSVLDFCKDGWNVFDFLIVTISLIPMDGNETILVARLLRIVRILRIITIMPQLKIIIDNLFKTLPKVGYVCLLMFVFFYIWAAIGSILFHHIDPERWGNIGTAMLLLLQMLTFDDWGAIMRDVVNVYPFAWTYFVSFLILNAFILFNMIVGIIVEAMSRHQEKDNSEQ